MAIEINKPKYTVQPPTVTLTGKFVDADNGNPGEKVVTSIGSQHIKQNGLVVKKRSEMLFQNDVLVELVPDPDFVANNYGGSNIAPFRPYNTVATTTNVVVGKRPSGGAPSLFFKDGREKTVYSGGTLVNEKSDTYYTLNGKDPSRTKSNLYTGAFTILRNTSGTDNIVLKTRTYAEGQASEVRTVELRIINQKTNIV